MRALLATIFVCGCGGVTTANVGPDASDSDANALDGGADASGSDAGQIPSTVFVTSSVHMANLGGLDGADMVCNTRAAAAGLTGTYVAWLSRLPSGGAVRLPANRSWLRPDGTIVAGDLTELLSGNLNAPISLDENGTTVGGSAWTGTAADGSIATNAGAGDCEGWTTSSSGLAVVGSTQGMDETWTVSQSVGCGRIHHLFCFEI